MALELIGAEAGREGEGRGVERRGEEGRGGEERTPASCCPAKSNIVHKLLPVVLPEWLYNTPQKPPRMSTSQGCAAFQVLQGSRESVAALTDHIRGLILSAWRVQEVDWSSRDQKVLGSHLFVFLWPH